MISIYYSAPYDIPADVTGVAFYKALERDRKCMKVMENTDKHQIRFSGYTDRMKELSIQADDHYDVMNKLTQILPSGSTMILPDAESLAEQPDEAVCLFGKFFDHNVFLEFTDDPWLDMCNYHLMVRSLPDETKLSLEYALRKTLLVRSQNKEPSVSITQRDSGFKKNSI